MIRGHVTPAHEAVIEIEVVGPTGFSHVVEAVIDTGFCDFLSLPSQVIEFL